MSRAGQRQPRGGKNRSLAAASYKRRGAPSRHGRRALCTMTHDHQHAAPGAAITRASRAGEIAGFRFEERFSRDAVRGYRPTRHPEITHQRPAQRDTILRKAAK